ncbi:unnamed protein product [Rotaria sp. Silwood2]|nr:unnamed protein product [Rotaria sp. Silwood2]
MIDIGANIGGYSMFTAGALGRFTLIIDCYLPNIENIARAVQIQRVQNRVVLVHNALYSKSGEYMTLSKAMPSEIELRETAQQNITSEFVVQTIRFDDLLPILIERKVQSVLIKIDIEGSEGFMCEAGSKTFDLIDIQLIIMEWGHGFRKWHRKRYEFMTLFFTERQYIVTDVFCNKLNLTEWETTWPGNVFWIKQINFKNNIC